MAVRTDGNPIGVQIDAHPRKRFSQLNLTMMALLDPFDSDAPPNELQGVELYDYRIMVGVMPEGAAHDDEDNWVCVIAVAVKHPDQMVYFIATRLCFGEHSNGNESSNLPRLVTFGELCHEGRLVGRFEQCTESDITWFMDYMQDNDDIQPSNGCAFPSAEMHGPFGDKGGYDNKGKAIKIHEVD